MNMKDINKLKDYRKKYKRYYGIDFGSDFVVHHLDFNRENNDISNLLLMPKELHEKYHYYLQVLDLLNWKSGELKIKTRIDQHGIFEYFTDKDLLDFLLILEECRFWLNKKNAMDFEIMNRRNKSNGNL